MTAVETTWTYSRVTGQVDLGDLNRSATASVSTSLSGISLNG